MHFLLTTAHGPAWDDGRGIREQDGWDEHATFMDSLVRDGVIVLGGPLAGSARTAHLVEADDAGEVRARWAPDPWLHDGHLEIASLDAWSLWLDGRAPDVRPVDL